MASYTRLIYVSLKRRRHYCRDPVEMIVEALGSSRSAVALSTDEGGLCECWSYSIGYGNWKKNNINHFCVTSESVWSNVYNVNKLNPFTGITC